MKVYKNNSKHYIFLAFIFFFVVKVMQAKSLYSGSGPI